MEGVSVSVAGAGLTFTRSASSGSGFSRGLPLGLRTGTEGVLAGGGGVAAGGSGGGGGGRGGTGAAKLQSLRSVSSERRLPLLGLELGVSREAGVSLPG